MPYEGRDWGSGFYCVVARVKVRARYRKCFSGLHVRYGGFIFKVKNRIWRLGREIRLFTSMTCRAIFRLTFHYTTLSAHLSIGKMHKNKGEFSLTFGYYAIKVSKKSSRQSLIFFARLSSSSVSHS